MSLLAPLDDARRRFGDLLDLLGFGPVETPYRVVWAAPPALLRRYEADGNGAGKPLLIVPAPIKRAHVWDLAPEVSVVRHCLAAGLRVYLLEWTEPVGAARNLGLEYYALRSLDAALASVAEETGHARVLVAGHSLGGTFAALFAAVHARRVAGLILLEAPLAFGPDAGAFRPVLAASPPESDAPVPGSFLNIVSIGASPRTFIFERWLDAARSLGDGQVALTHMRVVRWTLDELPLPGRLFTEVVEELYRADRFRQGTLVLGGRSVRPEGLTCPVLAVGDPRSIVIPPNSIRGVYDLLSHPDNRLLWYQGDRGVALQHVGVLVGTHAHQELWPEILAWAERFNWG